MKLAFSKGIPQ